MKGLGLVCLGVLLAGCVSIDDNKGVANVWRAASTPQFETGVTTRAQVLDALGPPSQVIDQDSGIIFYYLRERAQGKGLFLLVYNTSRVNVDYDRAIFFFDEKGVLVEHAFSKEGFPASDVE